MRTSYIQHLTPYVEVKLDSITLLRVWKLSVQRSTFLFLLCAVSACNPIPKTISSSQPVNAGVQIIPDAVLAAQKIKPGNRPTASDQQDLIDVISGSDQKPTVLIELLRDAGMVRMLQSTGPFTLMAPTDEAFAKLPPGFISRLTQPANHDQLVTFLKYHILPGRIDATDLQQTDGTIKTLSGQTVIVKGLEQKAMINDANVLRSDDSAVNGVVYTLDTVLLPGT